MSKSKRANYAYYKSLPENLNTFKLLPNSNSETQADQITENGTKNGYVLLKHNDSNEQYTAKNSSNFLSSRKSKRSLNKSTLQVDSELSTGLNNQNLHSKNSAEKMFDQILKLTYICYKNPLSKEDNNNTSVDYGSPHFLKPKSFFSLRKSLKKKKDYKNLSASEIILSKEFPAVNKNAKNGTDQDTVDTYMAHNEIYNKYDRLG